MRPSRYRQIWRIRSVRQVLVLGLAVRLPLFASAVVLTLHVVLTLGRGYGEAGLVAACHTVAIAISAPWRGRLLDRIGLRRTTAPALLIQVVVWSVAPFLPYAALLVLAVLSGLFVVPTFSIVRQAVIHAVPDDARRSALSLDSVATELAFIVGPGLGVWAATVWDTRIVLVVLAVAGAVAGIVLLVADPPLRSPQDAPGAVAPTGAGTVPSIRSWATVPVLSVFVAVTASTVVLGGTDVGVVAAVRAFGSTAAIGWVLAVWGAGSLLGGLVYGAWHRPIPVSVLLAALAASTAPVALSPSLPILALTLFGCGLLCAPTLTASVDTLGRLVPEGVRGEALGWHASCLTVGNALGAPLAGYAIDHADWRWGFVVVSVVELLAAGVAGVLIRGPAPVLQDAR